MKTNKSQIFFFDLIFSFVILVVSLGLFFTYFLVVNDNEDIHTLNREVLERFTTTNINALNNEEVREMFVRNEITNIQNTVAQQVAEFYYDGENELAQNLTSIFISSFSSTELNIVVEIYNTTDSYVLYSTELRNSKEDSDVVSSQTRDVIGFRNGESFGPYTFNIDIWT